MVVTKWQIAQKKRNKDRTDAVEEAVEMEETETEVVMVVAVEVKTKKEALVVEETN